MKTDVVQVTEKQMLKAIENWQTAHADLEEAKKREMHLRKFIIAQTFPKLAEGTNRVIFDHIEIVATGKVERQVDVAALKASKADLQKKGIVVDALIDYAPFLLTKAYRLLNTAQRKFFDTVLIIKDGSPQLKITVGSPAKK